MKKLLSISSIVFLILFVFLVSGSLASGPKSDKEMLDDLNEKIEELSGIHQKIGVQIEKNNQSINIYKRKISDSVTVIRKERSRTQISSFDSAIGNKRLRNHLKLIKRNEIYMGVLKKSNKYMKFGKADIETHIEIAKDDIAMIETVGKDALKDLSEDIEKIQREYLPEVDMLVVNVEITDNDLRDVWNRIVNNEY